MSERFRLHATPIAGLTRLERLPVADHRGFFERIFSSEELAGIGFRKPIAQVNRTLTRRRGAIRGLHFQRPPHAEAKLVTCLRGEVFDVALDLRQGSPTFLHWHAEILSGANNISFAIPEGFAHGFQTLTEDCELLYCHSAPYVPQSEDGVNAQDETLAIAWPLTITELSARDAGLPRIGADFTGIRV